MNTKNVALMLFSCLFTSTVAAQPFDTILQQIQPGMAGSYALLDGQEHKGFNLDVIGGEQSMLVLYLYTYDPNVPDGETADEIWFSGAASFGDRFTDLGAGWMELDLTMYRGAPDGGWFATGPVALGQPVGEAILRWTGPACASPRLKIDFVLDGIPIKSPPGGFVSQRLTQPSACCLGCYLEADVDPNVDPDWRDQVPGWHNACPLSAINFAPGGLPVHVDGSNGDPVCEQGCTP